MSNFKVLVATLTATTMVAAGVAFAAEQQAAPATSAPQSKVDSDLGTLSKDGANAFLDVAQARLAIFDGRVADAKKFAADADSSFDKAKTDRSVFMKAEADLKAPNDKAKAANEKAAKEMASSDADKAGGDKADMKTPIAWLPVDGDVMMNEDFKAHPEKVAAVKDANQSLAKGDKKGAMEKLKLADINIDYVVAVVPLKTTLSDVHQAAQDIDAGKYYEGSQLLRTVQDSAHYDVLDVNAVPAGKTAAPAASHAAGTKTN